mmetsp:Transcript_10871/g.30019  ORF Transcript_10871/g.30019 Transcript_10871/m.30019 type:complete len:148 (-) Transcript_10871:202-645(-)
MAVIPCSLARDVYNPSSMASSSSGCPCSTISPLSSTMTRLIFNDRITPSLCVTMTMHLVCSMDISSVSTTLRSLSESNAAVGSSRSSTSGDRMTARAMATRCRCPPDRERPPSPTRVSRFNPNSLPGSTGMPATRNDSDTASRYDAL